MDQLAREVFERMCDVMAKTYGVRNVAKEFAATPTIEQILIDKITESSDFLQRINVIGVTQQEGQRVLGSASGVIGKRTNTAVADRQTSDVMNLDGKDYRCEKTEYDVHITYAMINAWAKFPDFNDRFMKYVRRGIAQAKIKTGFHGISVAVTTDSVANPNGEDVNKGWFQHLREYNAGAQMLDEGGTAGQIRVGGAGDFANLDALVFDVLQMVGAPHRDGGDLVAMMGRELLAYDKTQLYKAQGATPSEKERIETASVTRTYGGLPSVSVPFMPPRGLLITSWDNLSIYFQTGAVRQKVEDNAKRDRVEHYNTTNEAYVVEDEEKAAGVEFANVRLWDGTQFV